MADLRAWGIELQKVRRVVAAISEWRTVGQIVAATALSRRTVENVLRDLGPVLARDGDCVRLAGPVDLPPPPRIDDDMEARRVLPPRVRGLDHVAATPDTRMRRARHLVESYELSGAHVVMLGDRDLTSLAVARAVPSATVTVVDVDEAVLRVVHDAGLGVRTVQADLRLPLPAVVTRSADLVFTDPPYTPSGVRLFCVRAVETLRRDPRSRLLFCYGFGDTQEGLAFSVQSALHELRLVAEAILPAFNRYDGAEAIGGASALYVCRPTRRTWAAARAPRDSRIYSHGRASSESQTAPLPGDVVAAAGRLPRYGEGWPAPAKSLGAWFADRPRAPVAVSLHPHYGASLTRIVRTARSSRLLVVAPHAAALEDAHPYEVTVRRRSGDVIVLDMRRLEAAPDPDPDAYDYWP